VPEPERRAVDLGAAPVLTVDVEEWYHNCWVEEYVDPARRPPLAEELDGLLPALLARLERAGAKATFFVLGEVARRLPARVREIDAAGHEVACHGELHRRANDSAPDAFRAAIALAKERLEQLLGREVTGFRAPEWSLRTTANPRLRAVAEAGFRYDSSLVPAPGSGARSNPRAPTVLLWPDATSLVELPPLVWGGPLRLPASGWSGRLLAPAALARIARAAGERGELPLVAVHPWEVVARACPGLLTGFARFLHEAARERFALGFDELLGRLRPRTTLAARCAALALQAGATLTIAAPTETGFRRAAERAAR
jgi:peptidoglycan/xylan/chitin deacetylase (PgdA/CDA1 family)